MHQNVSVRECNFLSLDTMQFFFQLIMYAKVFRLSSPMLAKISDWKINEKKTESYRHLLKLSQSICIFHEWFVRKYNKWNWKRPLSCRRWGTKCYRKMLTQKLIRAKATKLNQPECNHFHLTWTHCKNILDCCFRKPLSDGWLLSWMWSLL